MDTIHPPAEALRRFRATVGNPVGDLQGGQPTRELLVERWIHAVETHDTTALRALLLNRAEFAYLYYPTSQFSHEPLYQPPDLAWWRMQLASEKGIVRVLRRLGGADLGYVGLACPREPRNEGRNRIWEYCEVRRVAGGDTVSQRLFGGIVERDGRFKFAGYGNEF